MHQSVADDPLPLDGQVIKNGDGRSIKLGLGCQFGGVLFYTFMETRAGGSMTHLHLAVKMFRPRPGEEFEYFQGGRFNQQLNGEYSVSS